MNDAERLAERFKSIPNRAKFARDFSVPGGQAMIYQHINDLKPISIEAAIAYANGFGCSIAEISPTIMATLKKVLDGSVDLTIERATAAGSTEVTLVEFKQGAAEPKAEPYKVTEPNIAEVVALMLNADHEDRVRCRDAVRIVLKADSPQGDFSTRSAKDQVGSA